MGNEGKVKLKRRGGGEFPAPNWDQVVRQLSRAPKIPNASFSDSAKGSRESKTAALVPGSCEWPGVAAFCLGRKDQFRCQLRTLLNHGLLQVSTEGEESERYQLYVLLGEGNAHNGYGQNQRRDQVSQCNLPTEENHPNQVKENA